MKIKKKASNTYVSCENEGVVQSVNIKNISMLTAFMRDKIYSDTRKAAITETISNAVDEHKKHNVDRPVTVIVTKDFISIRDYAKGLPEQEVYDVFFTYLNSTKDKTDEYVGGFGIGAKSPSSYANTWYVSSYYNGKLNVYVSSVEGDNGVTRKLFSDIDKPGESGICVKIPITVKQGSNLDEELRLITLLLRDIVLFASSEKDNVIEVYYYPIDTLDTFEKLSEEEKETYKISKYFAKLCNYRKSDDSLGVFASKYSINNEFFIDEWKLTDVEKKENYDSDFTNVTNGQGIVFRYRKDNISSNDIIVSISDNDDRLYKRFYERQDLCTTYNSDNYTSRIIVTDGYSYYNVAIKDLGRYGEGEDIFKKINSITCPFFIGNYRYYYGSYKTINKFTNIVIFFDRSELPIMPNRETLRYDNLFFRKVYDRITEFYDYFKSNINNITYLLLTSSNDRHNLITGYNHTLVSNITYFKNVNLILEYIDRSDPKFSDILSVLSLNISSANEIYTYLNLKNIEDKIWFLEPHSKYLTNDFILENANLIYLHVANSTTKFISGNKLVPELYPVEFSITGMKEANDNVLRTLDCFTEYYLIVPEDVNVKNINYTYIEYGLRMLRENDDLKKSNSIVTKSDILKASTNTFWRNTCRLCVIQCKNEEAKDIIKTLNANAKKNKHYFLLSDIKEAMDTVLKQSIHYDSSVGFGFYLDSVVKVDRKNRILINRSKTANINDAIRATIRKALPANYKQDYINQKVEINIKDKTITEDTIIDIEGISIKNGKTKIDSIAKTKIKNIVIVPDASSSVYNKLNDNEKASVDRWLAFSTLNCEALLGAEYIYVLIANTQNYNKLKSLGAIEGKDLDAMDQYLLRLKELLPYNDPYTYLTMLISDKEYNIIEPDDVDKIFETDDKSKLILGIVACCIYKLIVPESDTKEFEYSLLQIHICQSIKHIKVLNGGVINNELHTKVVNTLIRPYKDNFIKLYKFVSNKNNYNKVWKAIKLLVSLHKHTIHKVFNYIESHYRDYNENNMCCFKFNNDVYNILSSIARAIRISSSDDITYTVLMQEFNGALGFDRNKNIASLDKQSIVEEIKSITGIEYKQP